MSFVINQTKLKKSFKGLMDFGEDIPIRTPKEIPEEDWKLFKKFLEAEKVSDLDDISDEEIIKLSTYTDRVVDFFEYSGPFSGSLKYVTEMEKISPLKKKRRVL